MGDVPRQCIRGSKQRRSPRRVNKNRLPGSDVSRKAVNSVSENFLDQDRPAGSQSFDELPDPLEEPLSDLELEALSLDLRSASAAFL